MKTMQNISTALALATALTLGVNANAATITTIAARMCTTPHPGRVPGSGITILKLKINFNLAGKATLTPEEREIQARAVGRARLPWQRGHRPYISWRWLSTVKPWAWATCA